MRKHPLSTSCIRSVTFNRFAAENNGTFFEKKREKGREFAISFSNSLKRSARTKKTGSGRNLGNLEKKETQPMGLASGLSGTKFKNRDAASYLKNSGTTTKHDIVQFARLSGHTTVRFFSLPFLLIARRSNAWGWLYCRTCDPRYCSRRT